MKMKKTMTKAVIGLLLPLTAGAAMAQSALSQLKLQAGDDAVALSEQIKRVQASVDPQVSPETAAKLQSAFQALKDKGFPGIQWQRLPLGVRYVSVPLESQNFPGGISYTALLPVGVLAPDAPARDPNNASYFILERAGEWIGNDRRYSAPIPMPARDIFAQCSDIDALPLRAWTLPEAVQRVQSCLDKTYNRDTVARTMYFVTAQAGMRGITITVSGRRLAGDPVIEDIGYALQKRGGKLLGFHASLEDKTEVLH